MSTEDLEEVSLQVQGEEVVSGCCRKPLYFGSGCCSVGGRHVLNGSFKAICGKDPIHQPCQPTHSYATLRL